MKPFRLINESLNPLPTPSGENSTGGMHFLELLMGSATVVGSPGLEVLDPSQRFFILCFSVLHTGKRWFIICPVAEHPATDTSESSPPLPLSSLQPEANQGRSTQSPDPPL